MACAYDYQPTRATHRRMRGRVVKRMARGLSCPNIGTAVPCDTPLAHLPTSYHTGMLVC